MSKSSVSNWTKLDKKIATLCALIENGKSNTNTIRQKAGNYCEQGRTINYNDESEVLHELKDEQIILLEFKERGKLNPENLWWLVDIEDSKKYLKEIIENPIINPCLNISLKKIREVFSL